MSPFTETRRWAEHRTFLLVDVEKSSGRLDPALMSVRSALYELLHGALDAVGVPGGRRVEEDRGDAVLILVAATVPKVTLLGPFVARLRSALAQHNLEQDSLAEWLRLRLAVHAGEVYRDGRGWGGEALTTVFRINEAPAVKSTLAASDRAQCVVAVSDELYRGVVRHGPGTEPGHYRAVRLELYGQPARAWVRVPGYTVPPVPPEPEPAPHEPPPARRGGGAHPEFHGPVQVGRDFNVHG